MRVAMISYNTFVKNEQNGWKTQDGNAVLLLQNEDGSQWGIPKGIKMETGTSACIAQVNSLWNQLAQSLPTLDKVIFYVGAQGAERTIELAAEHGLTPDRAIFVLCDCNIAKKMNLLRSRGFSSSKLIDCSCGGHIVMKNIYNTILEGNALPN